MDAPALLLAIGMALGGAGAVFAALFLLGIPVSIFTDDLDDPVMVLINGCVAALTLASITVLVAFIGDALYPVAVRMLQ